VTGVVAVPSVATAWVTADRPGQRDHGHISPPPPPAARSSGGPGAPATGRTARGLVNRGVSASEVLGPSSWPAREPPKAITRPGQRRSWIGQHHPVRTCRRRGRCRGARACRPVQQLSALVVPRAAWSAESRRARSDRELRADGLSHPARFVR
jgi:hypothetical protein